MGCTNIESDVGDNYSSIRKTAWNFIKEKGWSDSAKEDWNSATVTKIIVNGDYELLNTSYEGKEVFSVSFEDKENVLASTPVILVDLNRNKVIGFMLGE
ncbi:hypothetical protein [Bacillus carboniphilus]